LNFKTAWDLLGTLRKRVKTKESPGKRKNNGKNWNIPFTMKENIRTVQKSNLPSHWEKAQSKPSTDTRSLLHFREFTNKLALTVA